MTASLFRLNMILRNLPVFWTGILALMVVCATVGFAPPSATGGQPIRPQAAEKTKAVPADRLFARDNLIAWCIVPFDSKKRSPEERAAMLERLGFKHFAYDWRAEHIPTFDAEFEALKRHHVALDAFWAAGELNRDTRIILDALKRHGVKAELWVLLDFGADRATGAEQQRRIEAATAKLRPLAEEAAKIGCSLALYNHGGWFGEPENQIAIIERLKTQGVTNVGMVYNLHHGHDHLDRFAELLTKMKPYLKAVNLNGMDRGGDRVGRKILPLGQGALDLDLLRIIRDSGYRGPIGILGHTMDDAEQRLRDNLDGLDWLLPQLEGKPAGPRPKPRTPVPPPPAATGSTTPADANLIAALIRDARKDGDARRGAAVFASPKFACLSCHRVEGQGGSVGPDLTTAGFCIKPEELVESVLWPRRKVKEGYAADRGGHGRRQGPSRLPAGGLQDRAGAARPGDGRSDPDRQGRYRGRPQRGLADARRAGRRDDDRPSAATWSASCWTSAGRDWGPPATCSGTPTRRPNSPLTGRRCTRSNGRAGNTRSTATGSTTSTPRRPSISRSRRRSRPCCRSSPASTAENSVTGATRATRTGWTVRWNATDLGNLLSGVFRGAGVIVPKGVCVRLGDRGELSACFNPMTLCYEAVWSGGFVRFSADAPRPDGWPDPGRHSPAPPRGQGPGETVRLPRLLPARQSDRVRLSHRRRRAARRPLGRGRPVHAASSPRPTSTPSPT